jgi:putative hemolysin
MNLPARNLHDTPRRSPRTEFAWGWKVNQLDLQRREAFRLPVVGRSPLTRAVSRALRAPLERALALHDLATSYAALPAGGEVDEFLAAVLARLSVSYHVTDADLARIPASGPVVVVANHPFGGIEGLVLATLLRRIRPDVRIMANSLLGRISELAELFVLVDPFGGAKAAAASMAGLRAAARVLADDGLLAVFPAGEVAHFDLKSGAVADPPWSDTAARLAARAGAPVVPAYFAGSNGALFQLAGLLHPLLRTAMLPRELANKRRSTLAVSVGDPIPAARLAQLGEPSAMTAYLRERTYNLARRLPLPQRIAPAPATPGAAVRVAPPVPVPRLRAEVAAIPPGQLLAESADLSAFWARAPQIPALLQELGRLRELTFRAVGEGTGRSLDLDEFDIDYLHLVIWNREREHVVGAYRLGPTDELLPQRGIPGLYTSTLFDYRPRLLQAMGPALELGRSFVVPEYQRSYAPLLLLWRGIGAFVAANPRYRYLFGPVSISAAYEPSSRALIASYLRASGAYHPWSPLVRPRNPLRVPRRQERSDGTVGRVISDIEELSPFIADIERDRKGVPILVRQYFKLGARVLGLNVDREFADVLDVLVLVDLTVTDRRSLERYLGRDGAIAFLDHQRIATAAGAVM